LCVSIQVSFDQSGQSFYYDFSAPFLATRMPRRKGFERQTGVKSFQPYPARVSAMQEFCRVTRLIEVWLSRVEHAARFGSTRLREGLIVFGLC